MQKLSVIVFGMTIMVLGALKTDPATAALLRFNFTTEAGGAGSFILDTDTVATSDVPPFFGAGNFAYLNAISNFSFSSPYLSFSNITADYGVFPAGILGDSANFGETLGIPERTGTYSAVYSPGGCLLDPFNFCPVEFPIEYRSDVAKLPALADDPDAYPGGFDIAQIDLQTGAINSDRLTSYSVHPVPEPDQIFGTLVFGLVGAGGLLFKRQMRRKAIAR